MKTDSVIRQEGMNALLKSLGKVDAGRFVSLLIKEPFDYTKWQEKLFDSMTVRERSEKANRFTGKQNKK